MQYLTIIYRDEELLKGLYAMKFTKPSKIQEKALPLLVRNPPKNIIGQSQSGTGKTAAFVLAMLTRVDLSNPATQAVCLSPSRELARQTFDVLQEMSKYTKIKSQLLVPGAYTRDMNIESQIVIGTPGTMIDLVRRKLLKVSQLNILVLDEADNMLDAQGLADQSSKFKKMIPRGAQIALFSATFDDQVYSFAQKFVPNANEIRLKHNELNVKEIKQFYMDVDGPEKKMQLVLDLYEMMVIGSSIIFVRTKEMVNRLYGKMIKEGHAVSVLHGDLTAEDRDKLIDNYRAGKSKVLITTNVLSRGIDIPSVNLVINFDLPVDKQGRPDPATYLHRIGRTGRFGRKGVAISFVQDQESYNILESIREYFGGFEMTKIDSNDPTQIEKIVGKAMKA